MHCQDSRFFEGLVRYPGKIDHFLIGEGCHAIRESLRLLGVEESKFVVTRRDSHFVCDLLVVPSFHGAPGNIPPWAIEFLREQFLDVVSLAEVEATDLCQPLERLRDEKLRTRRKFFRFLPAGALCAVELEEMSLSAQIELFSEAEAVVAPHGAGLTNLIWCAPHKGPGDLLSALCESLLLGDREPFRPTTIICSEAKRESSTM